MLHSSRDMKMGRIERSSPKIEEKVVIFMFEFRIIELAAGIQVIDRKFKTSYNALTPLQMMEYIEIDIQLAIMDRMKRKTKVEKKSHRKVARNPLYKLACKCGIV